MSTKADNIVGTKHIGRNICLDILSKRLVQPNSTQSKFNYNTQKFPELLIKLNGNNLFGTLSIFESGEIKSVGIKRQKQFSELDKWIDSEIHYV